MKKARIISLALAMLMIICVFSACKPSDTTKDTSATSSGSSSGATSDSGDSNFNATGYPIVNEKITLKLMGATNVSMLDNWENIEFFKYMEELTNIALEFDVVNTDGFQARKALAFAGGDLPDFFYKVSPAFTDAEALDYGSQGLLIDMSEWVEQYGPNITNMFAERPEAKTKVTSADGGMYTLPYVYGKETYPAYYINTKWLDTLNLEMPTNLDDFYTVLKAFKEKDPNGNGKADEVPFSGQCASSIQNLSDFAQNFGIFMQSGNHFYYYMDDTLVYAPTSDTYKEFLIYMNKLYSEQLIDNSIFTMDTNQVKAKGEANQVGVVNCWAGYTRVGMDLDLDYFVIEPFEANGKKIWHASDGVSSGVFAITNKNEHVAETIRWIDFSYDQNGGALIANNGQEGVHYEWVDEAKTTWRSLKPDDVDGTIWKSQFSVQPGGDVPFYLNVKFSRSGEKDEHDEILYACYDAMEQYATVPFPTVTFDDADTQRVATLSADIDQHVKVSFAQFIAGEISIANDWDKYISDLNGMGLEEYTQIMQKAVDAAVK